jgi:LPXTG-motif cell wall-anchored protein
VEQPVKLGKHGSVQGKRALRAAVSLLGLAVFLFATAAPALAARKPKATTTTRAAAKPVLAKLTIRNPSVEVKKKGKKSYKPGKDGQTLRQGDALRTNAAGIAEIDYTDGSYTRLGAGTEFAITKLTNKRGGRQTQGSLTVGSAFSRATKVSETGEFKVEAGGATAAVEGTVFIVYSIPQGGTVTFQFIAIQDLLSVVLGSNPPVSLPPGSGITVGPSGAGPVTTFTYEEIAGNLLIAGNLKIDAQFNLGDTTLPGTPQAPPNPPPTTTTTAPPQQQPPQGPQGPTIQSDNIQEPTVQADVIQGQASQYPPGGELTVDNPNVEAGGEVSFHGSGCRPGEIVTVLFDGKQVGTLPTDSSGRFAGRITIPPGTPPGPHLLTVRGSVCELNVVINVLGARALAFTGSSSHTSTYVLAGAAAVVLGSAFVFGSRRRRSAMGARRQSA